MDRSLLARATDGSEAPTPGYLYVDLAKGAAANPSVCQDMVKYLINRLTSKQNVYVKTKACKVLGKLCEQVPRNQFRRAVSQDPTAVAAIKAAIAWRGPMDPLQGDAKNEAVRKAARECLDAVYAEQPEGGAGNAGGGGANPYGGYGGVSSSYGGAPHANGGGPGGPSARRMEGIGNPMFGDPRLGPQGGAPGGNGQQKIQAAVKEASEVVMGMIRDPLARHVGAGGAQQQQAPAQGHSGDLPGYNRGATYGRPPPGASELSRQTGGQWTMASNRGPGAIQGNTYYQERAAAPVSTSGATPSRGGIGGSWGNVASQAREPAYGTPSISVTPSGRPSLVTSGATADGSYERTLITELCPPGGLRAVPPAEKLQDFIRAVSTLNADWICPVLLDALEEGQPWIIRAKALCVMEAAIRHGQQGDINPYRDFFFACREEVEPLARHNRAPIAEPAGRVLLLLGVAAGANGGSGRTMNSAPVAAPVAAAPNLLDFGDDVAAPPAAAPPPPPPVAAAAGNMFGGMQVKSKAPAAPSPPAVAPPLAAPAPADLFDFGAPAPAAATPVAVADPFGAVAAPTPAAVPTSMFAQLQVKDTASEAAPPATPAVEAAPIAGSAFGFINSGSAPAAAAPAAAAMPAAMPPPAPTTFDPLKNLTPTTAAKKIKSMQMSPQQMQAMAYQQQMYQLQMQQMQMALMMQQGGGAGMVMPPGMPLYRQGSGSAAVGGMPPVAGGPRLAMGQQQPRAAQKDDKKFDFVQDAMFSEKKK